MKRKFLGSFLLFMLMTTVALAAPRVIPYPPGLDTKTEGASSMLPENNHSDSIYFTFPDFYEFQNSERLTVLTHYPTYQQSTEYTCGPAAAITVLYWFGKEDLDEMQISKLMGTRPYPYGTDVKQMAKFFQGLGWEVKSSIGADKFSRYDDYRAFILKYLRQGIPLLVESVEWGGHWRVLIGYDDMGTKDSLDDMLIFMDPYDTSDHLQDGYAIQNSERFFSAWFDHLILPKSQNYQPWVVAYPKGTIEKILKVKYDNNV